MRLIKTLLAASALTAMLAGGAYAKTLVYCSEGSPEGFDPGLYESGTTLDVNVATYEGLVKFKLGSTERLARAGFGPHAHGAGRDRC